MSNPIVILLEALLGGLVLNVMPCVLPVLTMKVFHAVEHGSGDKRARQLHGVAYTAGVVTAFLVLAVGVLVLRTAGKHIGWGMQFQHPEFVAALVALIFTFGLNSLGVFEWTLSLSTRPGQEGYGASFGNGVFAAVMSTPCSAPFLGTAAALALAAGTPPWLTVAIFVAIGLGLAAPFALVSFVPAAGKLLPRPGAWMETFKHVMGFTLLAAAVWLYGTLQAQISRAAATDFLYFLLVLAVALWSTHHFGGVLHGAARRYTVRGLATGLVLVAGWQLVHFDRDRKPSSTPALTPLPSPQPALAAGSAPTEVTAAAAEVSATTAPEPVDDVLREGHVAWVPFDPSRIRAALANKRPVFVDFTAEWCANCKTNERVSIETDQVRSALDQAHFLPMKADWTNEDELIGQWLQQLGRSGIPAYVIYYPDGSRDLLPEGLVSADTFVEHISTGVRKFPATQQVLANAR
jgi:thiol:disulfide interchange protein DsbD